MRKWRRRIAVLCGIYCSPFAQSAAAQTAEIQISGLTDIDFGAIEHGRSLEETVSACVFTTMPGTYGISITSDNQLYLVSAERGALPLQYTLIYTAPNKSVHSSLADDSLIGDNLMPSSSENCRDGNGASLRVSLDTASIPDGAFLGQYSDLMTITVTPE